MGASNYCALRQNKSLIIAYADMWTKAIICAGKTPWTTRVRSSIFNSSLTWMTVRSILNISKDFGYANIKIYAGANRMQPRQDCLRQFAFRQYRIRCRQQPYLHGIQQCLYWECWSQPVEQPDFYSSQLQFKNSLNIPFIVAIVATCHLLMQLPLSLMFSMSHQAIVFYCLIASSVFTLAPNYI